MRKRMSESWPDWMFELGDRVYPPLKAFGAENNEQAINLLYSRETILHQIVCVRARVLTGRGFSDWRNAPGALIGRSVYGLSPVLKPSGRYTVTSNERRRRRRSDTGEVSSIKVGGCIGQQNVRLCRTLEIAWLCRVSVLRLNQCRLHRARPWYVTCSERAPNER